MNRKGPNKQCKKARFATVLAHSAVLSKVQDLSTPFTVDLEPPICPPQPGRCHWNQRCSLNGHSKKQKKETNHDLDKHLKKVMDNLNLLKKYSTYLS